MSATDRPNTDAEPSGAPFLAIEGVYSYYGNIAALRGVDLTVERGEIVTLIGANGAGKSTLLMTVFGKPRATRGRILFDGEDITRARTHELVHRGIAQSPEGRRIFPRMSVLENLQMGAIPAPREHFEADLERVFELFPVLAQRRRQRGGTLSGGEQQMLAIGRALMSRPRLLLLDEPSLGLAPLIVKRIFEVLRELNQRERMTIFLVEQNAYHALKLAHRGYVLVNGEIVLSGGGRELLAMPEVRAAYLEGSARPSDVVEASETDAGEKPGSDARTAPAPAPGGDADADAETTP
ncbi:ABC transporter related protein [Haliangium ochraceum DSM 14365]|uniref:ABC transporter related protein n=1 Tax=Haliangium ochraceum (strain DSM 14365 / JCM 11303 / SMP-2) TaxID=502025 RepID=D0LYL1_HALO1|nr:ABC transporter ATP-binding protein [Haliangium ochraceum]ACY17877.1 ABC transporter related protein [Haliangium ochraceum DSM 14365]